MLRTWNEYSQSHFSGCHCARRAASTLWALIVCSGFGAVCGAVAGAPVGAFLGFFFGGSIGCVVGLGVGMALGAFAGLYAGLIGATIGGRYGWFIGGFLGGALVGWWFFPITGFFSAIAAAKGYEAVFNARERNRFCRWVFATIDNSDLAHAPTGRIWCVPVLAFYFLTIYLIYKNAGL